MKKTTTNLHRGQMIHQMIYQMIHLIHQMIYQIKYENKISYLKMAICIYD